MTMFPWPQFRRVSALALLVLSVSGCKVSFPNVTPERPAILYSEAIDNFSSTVDVARDGTLMVVETIRYDFESTSRHGIFRDIPHRFNIANDDKHQRSTPISVQSVSSPDPTTPTQFKIESPTD